MVENARFFAAGAHAGQVRKYTFEPYITHPEEVARIVMSVPHTMEMAQAAYLHDVLEDTPTTMVMIEREFGKVVAHFVSELTDMKMAGNRATRKAVSNARLHRACHQVQTIKVADLISNTGSVVAHDPAFARVYLREKRDLLQLLTQADPTLLARAWAIVNEGLSELEKTA